MPSPITNAVTICNSALLKLGADVIGSLSGTGRAAITCNTLYNYLRDEVMGESPWRFATVRTVLTPNSTTPAFDYLYSYDIPSDCLRPLEIKDSQGPWTVEYNEALSSAQILSNDTSINLRYIFRNVDESTWDARFCEALAWRLCMELALSLTQSIPMKQEAEKSYQSQIALARAMNGQIGTLEPLVADLWSGARKGFRQWRAQTGQAGDP